MYDGVYYHTEIPGEEVWMRLNTDVDPWMDEVFTSGNKLVPATVYTCSCPNHAHAILSAPQATHKMKTHVKSTDSVAIRCLQFKVVMIIKT